MCVSVSVCECACMFACASVGGYVVRGRECCVLCAVCCLAARMCVRV